MLLIGLRSHCAPSDTTCAPVDHMSILDTGYTARSKDLSLTWKSDFGVRPLLQEQLLVTVENEDAESSV